MIEILLPNKTNCHTKCAWNTDTIVQKTCAQNHKKSYWQIRQQKDLQHMKAQMIEREGHREEEEKKKAISCPQKAISWSKDLILHKPDWKEHRQSKSLG